MYASSDISGPNSRPRSPFGIPHPNTHQYVYNVVAQAVSAAHLWLSWKLEIVHSFFDRAMSFIFGQKSTLASPPENTGVVIMAGGEGSK